ncbi:MAG: FRG domain-containing protein [Ruminiclostridium sp.]|nr:FRG domain-containing protein [Ruminiclostridium sp.]
MCKYINNLLDFVQEIIDIRNNENEKTNKRIKNNESIDIYSRKDILYRGQPSDDYLLIPSIGRGKGHWSDQGIIDYERELIIRAKMEMPHAFKNDMQPIELLALLQHFKIPTRLLDVTENPLVALYFAVSNNYKENGEVFVFSANSSAATFPIMNAIADTYNLTMPTYPISLDDFVKKASERGYWSVDKADGEWIKSVCNHPLFVYAPIHTERQKAQRGRYILFPNEIDVYELHNKESFMPNIKPMEKNDSCIIDRFIIPANSKKRLLAELNLFGISQKVLFADSIDTVCEEIVKEYL